MKLSLFLTLVVATAAQDDTQTAAQQSQGSQGSDDQAAQTQQQGYGSDVEAAYGSEVESYAAPSVAAFAPVYKPQICVSLCPTEAPFFSLHSGACSPCARQVLSTGYRHLEADYAAPAVQQSYTAPVESYATPAYEPECLQPAHTVDTRNNRVGRSGTIALWIGFVFLFLSSIYFINRYLWYFYVADTADNVQDWRVGSEWGTAVFAFLAEPSLICGMVTFIASLAYLAMATHHGFYTRCFDGREFYYARYLDWVITTPMMLHALAYIGNMEDNIWHYLFFNDVLMIISGLIGSTVGSGDKWVFFGFSILTFIPIIYYLCERKNRALDNGIYDSEGNRMVSPQGLADGAFIPHVHFIVTYTNIMRLTVTAWALYPVVWILAEGTGTISANGEAIFYTVLDIISKAGFGAIIVSASRNSYAQAIAAGVEMRFNSGNEDDFNWNEAVLAMGVGGGALLKAGESML